MKKIISFLLTLLLVFACCFSLFGCDTERDEKGDNTITVFSWEDYIDLGDEEVEGRDSVLDIFEEETGIHVNYVTFANSEEMYNELEKNPDACDLLCPSEYMIMKMMTEGKLRSFATPENYKTKCSQYIKDTFKKLGIKDSEGKLTTKILSDDEQTTYAVGYMWGTMGYVYDIDRFSEDELNDWTVALDSQFYDRVTIKDSIRDTYIMAVGSVYHDELESLKEDYQAERINGEEYNKKITEIFNRCDKETVDKVEDFLIDLRNNLYYFEVDNAKTDIIRGRIDLYFAWSGDAVYAMDSGEENDIYLGYVVPDEGSNIWFDGFVMPKSVSDSQAELVVKFLNFVCEPEIAVRNMEYIGYVSVISGDADEEFSLNYVEYDEAGENIIDTYSLSYTGILDWVQQNYCAESKDDEDFVEEVDLSYFFGDETIVYSKDHGRQLYGLYADSETIARCAIMDNFNDESLALVNKMWENVKFIKLSVLQIVLIIVGLVALILVVVFIKALKGNVRYSTKDKSFFK